jgi:predicted ribosomally synthesized peptide with nif11-like leader
MSSKTAQELIKKMATDVVFRQRVENAATKEEKRRILDEAGFAGITSEQIKAAAQSGEFELSDAELEAVAGGKTASWVAAISTVVGAAAALL